MRHLLLAAAASLLLGGGALAAPPALHGGMAKLTPQSHRQEIQSQFGNLTYTRTLGKDAKAEHFQPTKPVKRAPAETVTLTVNVKNFDEDVMYFNQAFAYPNGIADTWYFAEFSAYENPTNIEYLVPAGNYDIEIMYVKYTGDLVILTASDIEVSGDMSTTVDVADATVRIDWTPLLPDGTTPFTDIPIMDIATEEILDLIPGNAYVIDNSLCIYNTKHNAKSSVGLAPYIEIDGEEKTEYNRGSIECTPNKDLLFFFENRTVTRDGGIVIPLTATATESQSATNDISDYLSVPYKFITTPWEAEALTSEDENNHNVLEFDRNLAYCLGYVSVKEGLLDGQCFMTLFDKSIPPVIYVCQDRNQVARHMVMPTPTLIEDWASDYCSTVPPIDVTVSPYKVCEINNTDAFTPYLKKPEERYTLLKNAVNPWLSFDLSESTVWNYGCPAMVFTTDDMPWAKGFKFAYIGRLGENRSIDLLDTELYVSVDGEFPSDEVLENMQWGQLPSEGKIEFFFVDNNVEVDRVTGRNVAGVGFDMANADWQPPTVQIARMMNTKGEMTDRFTTASEGVVEFYAGDFEFHYNPETYARWYTEKEPKEVLVEYAPNGTEDFLPLEVKHIAERDFMPGFGTCYHASLASVDRKSENGWFNLRITLEDEAGNYQSQILTPAFAVGENVGVETISNPGIGLTVIGGHLTVCGCRNPAVEIYAADGMKVAASNASTLDVTSLERGIYVVRIADGDKMAIRKIRI